MSARADLRDRVTAALRAVHSHPLAAIATLSSAELAGWCAGRVLLGLGWRHGELEALRDRARALGVALVVPPSPEAAVAVLRGAT
ncbi:MAG: hypothetical protein H5U20_07655 [Rhodobacteraceae bacterium]|nr:hypothetical protein [Paracoccaceae bacterium]